MKHCDARCGFLGFRHFKRTVSEVEIVKVLLHEVREDLGLDELIVLLNIFGRVLHLVHFVPILKHILLNTVPMHVKVEIKLLVKRLIHQLLT